MTTITPQMIGFENLPNSYFVTADVQATDNGKLNFSLKTVVLDTDEDTWDDIGDIENITKITLPNLTESTSLISNISKLEIMKHDFTDIDVIDTGFIVLETYNRKTITIDSDNDTTIYGPSQKLILEVTKIGDEKQITIPQTYQVFNGSTVHYGSFHFHEDGVMEGSYHEEVSHDSLTIQPVEEYNKIKLLNNDQEQQESIAFSNAVLPPLPQIENDYFSVSNGKISFYTFLNEETALFNNEFNKKLILKNKNFFLSHPDKIEIINFEVSYFATTQIKKFNTTDTFIGMKKSEDEFSVINGIPREGDKLNKLVFDGYTENVYDSVITDDQKLNSRHSCTIEAIDKVDGVHVFMTNHLDAFLGSNERRYKTKITFKNKIKERLKSSLQELKNQIKVVNEVYLQKNNSKLLFGKMTGQKFVDINTRFGFDVSIDEINVVRVSQSSDSRQNSAYWIKIPELVDYIESFLHEKTNGMYLFQTLNPISGDIEDYDKVISFCNKLIFNVEKYYNLQTITTSAQLGKNLLSPDLSIVETISSETVSLSSSTIKAKILPTVNNSITKTQYRNRVQQEVDKFFTKTPRVANNSLSNLKQSEKQALSNMSNKEQYFTAEKIKVNNMTMRLLDTTEQIFQPTFFNALKRERNLQKKKFVRPNSLKFPESLKTSKINVKDKSLASNYLGKNSTFLSAIKQKKEFKNTNLTQELDLDDSISEFKKGTKQKVSLKKFDPTDQTFAIKTNKAEKIAELPLQIKSIMLSGDSKVVRFPLLNQENDSFKNIQTREAIKQNFLSIKKIEYLSGFKTNDGIKSIKEPQWMPVNQAILQDQNNYLCRIVDYENQDFGITKDEEIETEDKIFILRN